jgi:hypothetical protein
LFHDNKRLKVKVMVCKGPLTAYAISKAPVRTAWNQRVGVCVFRSAIVHTPAIVQPTLSPSQLSTAVTHCILISTNLPTPEGWTAWWPCPLPGFEPEIRQTRVQWSMMARDRPRRQTCLFERLNFAQCDCTNTSLGAWVYLYIRLVFWFDCKWICYSTQRSQRPAQTARPILWSKCQTTSCATASIFRSRIATVISGAKSRLTHVPPRMGNFWPNQNIWMTYERYWTWDKFEQTANTNEEARSQMMTSLLVCGIQIAVNIHFGCSSASKTANNSQTVRSRRNCQ